MRLFMSPMQLAGKPSSAAAPEACCAMLICAVLCWQVDVEGWEWSVMQGASKLLSTYDVQHIMMEYSPGEHMPCLTCLGAIGALGPYTRL